MRQGDWTRQYITATNRIGAKTGRNPPGSKPLGFAAPVGKSPVFSQLPNARQAATEVIELCHYSSGDLTSVATTNTIDIFCPSSRLTTSLQLYVERSVSISNDAPIPGSVPCVASIFALGINPLTGNPVRLQNLATLNPPFVFTIDPSYRAVRIVVQLDHDNWDFTSIGNVADLKCSVAWEPNVEMDADELNRLFAGCRTNAPASVNQ